MAVAFGATGTAAVQTVAGTLNVTPGLPAGVASGDVLLASLLYRTLDGVDLTVTASSGWTLIGSTFDTGGGTGAHARYYARSYTGGLAAPTFTTATNISSAVASVISLTGATVPTSANVTIAAESGAAANLRTAGPVAATASAWLVGSFGSRSGEVWTSSDLTDRSGGTNGVTGATLYVGTTGPVSAGSTMKTASMSVASGVATKMLLFVEPSGTPPVVSAGADQTAAEPYKTVTLAATSSESSVSWSQLTGTSVTLSGSGLSRTFTAPGTLDGETLTFRASATNGNGTTTDDVAVTVLPVNERVVVGAVQVPVRIFLA